MALLEFIILIIIAIVIGSIFYYGFRRRGPWNLLWVFIILFLVAWAGRLWIVSTTTVHWGYAWVPVIFWVLLIALLITGLAPKEEKRTPQNNPETGEEVSETGGRTIFGRFFWLLLLALIAVIIAGLLR